MPNVHHLRHTHLEQNRFVKGEPEHGMELADDIERIDVFFSDTFI